MKVLKIISSLLAIFLSLPIGLYLQYRILQGVNATNVMWLLFWVNIPLLVLIQSVAKIAEVAANDR